MFINFYRAVKFAVIIYPGNAGPDNVFTAWICLRGSKVNPTATMIAIAKPAAIRIDFSVKLE
jgi:hypothetical protein